MDDNDEALIRAARTGDDEAFGRLVQRYRDTVYVTVVAIIRDFDEAHDVAQEVFLRAWFALHALDDATAWPGWIRSIARNRALSWIERRRRQPPIERMSVDLASPDTTPDGDLERRERRRLVMAALDRLPEDNRQLLMLHYMEDVPTTQIAAHLNITPAAARQRLHRARRHLQREMETTVADVLRNEAPGEGFDDGVTALIERSRGLFHRVEYRSAIPILESAREQAPMDSLVSMLLADAYTFSRSRDELEEDRAAYDRAVGLLDEVLEREPGNLLAGLRRAAVRSLLGQPDDTIAEQQSLVEAARGGPYEAVAELELARRHLQLEQAPQALAVYEGLLANHPWLGCVLHSEMGVACAMARNVPGAIAHFQTAVDLTSDEAMAVLRERSEQLIGTAYWAFWRTVDNRASRQCQNHAWLAGLHAVTGNRARSQGHLADALAYLRSDELGPAGPVLKRQFVEQMERMFPSVADEPEVQVLRQELA